MMSRPRTPKGRAAKGPSVGGALVGEGRSGRVRLLCGAAGPDHHGFSTSLGGRRMDVVSSVRGWSFPFSMAALPRRSLTMVQGIELSPGPDRMRGMELLASEAGLSPAHRHAYGVAALLCGMPCGAVHTLMQATGENPDECAAWVDLATALAGAGRPEPAAWALSRTLTPTVSGPDDGGARPVRPFPARSEEEQKRHPGRPEPPVRTQQRIVKRKSERPGA